MEVPLGRPRHLRCRRRLRGPLLWQRRRARHWRRLHIGMLRNVHVDTLHLGLDQCLGPCHLILHHPGRPVSRLEDVWKNNFHAKDSGKGPYRLITMRHRYLSVVSSTQPWLTIAEPSMILGQTTSSPTQARPLPARSDHICEPAISLSYGCRLKGRSPTSVSPIEDAVAATLVDIGTRHKHGASRCAQELE